MTTPQQRRYFAAQRVAIDAALKTARMGVRYDPSDNYLDLALLNIDATTFERHQRLEDTVADSPGGLTTRLSDYR